MDIRFRYLCATRNTSGELTTVERGWYYLKDDTIKQLQLLAAQYPLATFFLYEEEFDEQNRTWRLKKSNEISASVVLSAA